MRNAVLMIGAGVGLATAGFPGVAAAAEMPKPPSRVSSFQKGTFAVMGQSAVRPVPKFLLRRAQRGSGLRFGLNPALARKVIAPDSDAAHPLYVVPSATGLCLVASASLTCQTDSDAAKGKLWLQFIKAAGNSPGSPLPPEGAAIPSRVVGVAPLGTTAVTATTKSAATVTGVVARGMFAISGDSMVELQLVRAPLLVPVFSG